MMTTENYLILQSAISTFLPATTKHFIGNFSLYGVFFHMLRACFVRLKPHFSHIFFISYFHEIKANGGNIK